MTVRDETPLENASRTRPEFFLRSTMLEAKLQQAALLKRLLDCMSGLSPSAHTLTPILAIKELVTDANFNCTEEGIVRVSFILTCRSSPL